MPDPAPTRVLVVSASMGAGHDAAAAELVRRLQDRGVSAAAVDLLTLAGGRGPRLRAFYRLMIARAPAAYQLSMSSWQRYPAFFERVTARGAAAYERGLLDRIAEHRPDVVASTFNLAAQALGRLRLSGRLAVPVASYVTDAGAHPYWVARGADLHLAPLPATAAALAALGARDARPVGPLVDRTRLHAAGAIEARARWGLAGRVVVVNGGSWGVGPVRAATRALAAVGDLTVVVLCGRSATLAAAVGRIPGARAIGWTGDVAGLLAAADVVVDTAGGTTAWEALAARRALVLHRPIAGHGRLNALALHAAGLATVTTSSADLTAAARTATPPGVDVTDAADAADAVLALAAR